MYKSVNLCYFSGTGNTKALAQAAADELKRAGSAVVLKDIAFGTTISSADLLGIFLPVYSLGAPRIVMSFVRSLPAGKGAAAFVIANAAGMAGPAHAAVARELTEKGYQVKLADWVNMPSNYIGGREAVSDDEARKVIGLGQAKVVALLKAMETTPNSIPRYNPYSPIALANRMFWQGLNYLHRFYRANDKCTGCGACVAMCPTQSIALSKDAHPLWQAGCEHCMRCVNFCPEAAIEFGRFTKGKKRYTYWLDGGAVSPRSDESELYRN